MNHKLITDRLFYQKVLSIMLPVALQQTINMGVNMLDTMMLGQMGEVQISASSLANQYYNFFTIFCMGIIGGSSVLAAQYWGARDLNKVQQTFCLAIRMALLFSVTFALLTWLFPAQIMRIYTPDPAVIEQGVRYLRITTFVFVIHGTSLVAEQLMRSVGQARLGLVVSSISFVVNLIANYIFIFGKFGAPRMEIAGAALGTLFARIAEFLVTFGYIFFRDRSLHFRFSHLFRKVERSLLMNYLRLGVPVLVSDGLLGLGSNLVSIILGHMGAAVVAANAICQVIDRLFTVVIQGIANASSIVTGHTIGEGDTERAMQQGYTFYLLSVAFGLIAVVMVLACGPLTIRVYSLTDARLYRHRVLPVYPVRHDKRRSARRRRYQIPDESRHPVYVAGVHPSRVYRRSGPGLARMADHPLSANRLCHQIGLVRHTVKERKMDTVCGGCLSPGTKLKIF